MELELDIHELVDEQSRADNKRPYGLAQQKLWITVWMNEILQRLMIIRSQSLPKAALVLSTLKSSKDCGTPDNLGGVKSS
ncbi:hypothetical protein TNCT_689301 [Trichonephila clavata]|uniref:Uncharacterized protein n=1 Tax=Trichonephila clavata TaxID=2740835 RepID=A0A8X6IB79_TRICU|nr:hypothetical protein TNCT_689301 [Trichonephila clavata]